MNLTEIEALAQRYAESYRELEGAVQTLEDGVRTIKRKLLPTIRRLAEESADHKGALLAAIADAKTLFEKPRTRLMSGVKVGLTKRRGQVVIDDEEATIRRIRELLPYNQAELVIRVRESVHKPAVYDLTGGDLKRLGIKIDADTDEAIAKIAGEDIERMVDALLANDDAPATADVAA
jgi:arsenate reductase-like glutaredoxin family protein